ncbi:multiple epidermal growth factor-like domains 10 [Elysia marginata]|uniref:Multiple epidermal growth factor-like domains 10 n=1 Tax=Elysia marginata TaxID=1093978 RepID=A0AAV4ERK9_9GAST|nr:multiple epidermal growth factor-like domains 10 [Elysia marginata]
MARGEEFHVIGIGVKRQNDSKFYVLDDNDTFSIPLNYFEWLGKNPGPEQCVALKSEGVGTALWVTVDCDYPTEVICEKTPDSNCEDDEMATNCSQNCLSSCVGGEYRSCDDLTGRCLDRCKRGYKGPTCDKACDPGEYGFNCERKCSPTCAGEDNACDPLYGRCRRGCVMGYTGPHCLNHCPTGMYGVGCLKKCSSNCAGKYKACDEISGRCAQGCVRGYQGDRCDIVHYNMYGVGIPKVLGIAFIFLVMWVVIAVPVLKHKPNEILGRRWPHVTFSRSLDGDNKSRTRIPNSLSTLEKKAAGARESSYTLTPKPSRLSSIMDHKKMETFLIEHSSSVD